MWTIKSLPIRARQLLGAATLFSMAGLSAAASYPTSPVTLVVPFPPGGSVDMVARDIAKHLNDAFDVPFVVANRAGASGNIGASYVARSKPDGLTLLVTSSGVLTANQALYKNPGFDAIEDFTPVIRLVDQPNILLVHPSVKAHSVQELVDLAKAQPGQLSIGSAGIGTGQDIAAREFIEATKIDVLQVPYKGGAPALNDLLGGQIQAMFETSPTALPYANMQSDKLRALAISSAKRSPLLPEVPTVAEAGIAGYESITWIGVTAPADTPKEIVERLNSELNKALRGDLGKKLAEISLDPLGGSPESMGEMIARDSETHEKILKAAGVEPQ